MKTGISLKPRPRAPFKALLDDDTNSENNIYITTVSGPFDIQIINDLGKTRFRYLSELENAKIANIIVLQGHMYITPEALERFTQILRHQLDYFKKSFIVAFVAPEDSVGRDKYCAQLQAIYAKLNVPWRDFEEIDDARAWIRSVLDD